jgi:hypothetical protein
MHLSAMYFRGVMFSITEHKRPPNTTTHPVGYKRFIESITDATVRVIRREYRSTHSYEDIIIIIPTLNLVSNRSISFLPRRFVIIISPRLIFYFLFAIFYLSF